MTELLKSLPKYSVCVEINLHTGTYFRGIEKSTRETSGDFN